jgi:arginase
MSSARLVRVPAAWGDGGDAMVEAAAMEVGLATAATVSEASLSAQTARLREAMPERPVVLGGCCCAHVGGAAGVADGAGRIAVIWIDAHGDLNTPETSPSGNEWGMPFRMILDDGFADVRDCALIGARSLDPPEQQFIREQNLASAVGDLDGVAGAYVAFDFDALDATEIDCYMPEPDGLTLDEGIAIVEQVAARTPILGIGLTGLVPSEQNPARLRRVIRAAGLD